MTSICQPLVGFWGAMTGRYDALRNAYLQLQASTINTDQARLIYGSLLVKGFVNNKHYLLDWLVREMQFEAFAAATSDREWAAIQDLELANYGSKEDRIALYKERLARTLWK
ncbi:hypothetical protein [Spirosoma harenae]